MAIDGGNVAGKAAMGAAAGAPFGGIGAGVGALGGAAWGVIEGLTSDDEAPVLPPSQYGGNPLTNQLAAQQYAAGLQQQQAQGAREAAFYSNANTNFDIANAAQMRGGPKILTSAEDRARQLAALSGTNAAIGNVNQAGQQLAALGSQSSNQVTATGDRLTELGTRPMGASYAEAQLRQGQDAAMAQQLAMARSGRSLGSGQASMNQAMFNNAAINQQTNLAAANARIQEQNAYNQFQAGTLGAAGQQYNANNQFQASALGAAGQQYGAAGALSGQAGGQATTYRQGNEGVQAQNAQLGQNQQSINNQTTGIYNQLGAQQQGYGMQANAQGQNAYQFGANQASGMQTAQLNADTGRLSPTVATNVANQNQENTRNAANINLAASGFGAASEAVANSGGAPSGGVNQNNPSASPYAPITKASKSMDPADTTASDERLKTNIKALGGDSTPTISRKTTNSPAGSSSAGAGTSKPGTMRPRAPEGYSTIPEGYTAEAGGYASADRKTFITNDGKNLNFKYGMDTPMDDENAGKVAVQHETNIGDRPASYAQTIAALNNGYRASQFAPADVLNHVPGAGSGPGASQSALLQHMAGKTPTPTPVVDRAGLKQRESELRMPEQAGAIDTGGWRQLRDQTPKTATAAPAPAAWGDVFNAPQLGAKVNDYLAGGNPYNPVEPPREYAPAYSEEYAKASAEAKAADVKNTSPWDRMSDARSKTRIRELEGQLAALQGPPSASFEPEEPDTDSLDRSEYGKQVRPGGWRDRDQLKAPAVDFRPARPYQYEYKDPSAPGAAPGKHVGPMAQDLLRSPTTAATVHDTPQGLQVDTPRLTLAVAGAMSEQQRKTEELERQLAALEGSKPGAYKASLYPQTRAPR